jgi:hypothetical protein
MCFPLPGISLQDFKHPLLFSQNIEESCTFQKIDGLEKVKLQINKRNPKVHSRMDIPVPLEKLISSH